MKRLAFLLFAFLFITGCSGSSEPDGPTVYENCNLEAQDFQFPANMRDKFIPPAIVLRLESNYDFPVTFVRNEEIEFMLTHPEEETFYFSMQCCFHENRTIYPDQTKLMGRRFIYTGLPDNKRLFYENDYEATIVESLPCKKTTDTQ